MDVYVTVNTAGYDSYADMNLAAPPHRNKGLASVVDNETKDDYGSREETWLHGVETREVLAVVNRSTRQDWRPSSILGMHNRGMQVPRRLYNVGVASWIG